MKLNICSYIVALIIVAIFYVLLLTVPAAAVRVELNPVTTSPADIGLAYEDFVVTPVDTGLVLHGWWMQAAAFQLFPTATLEHIVRFIGNQNAP